jgi:hypothetical protein
LSALYLSARSSSSRTISCCETLAYFKYTPVKDNYQCSFLWPVLGVPSITAIFISLFSFSHHYMFLPLQAILKWCGNKNCCDWWHPQKLNSFAI